MTRLVVGSATDIGLVRSNNQDQLLVAPGLYAVADGMGGHAAGEVASLTAIKALDAAFEASDERTAASLESAAKAANRAVWEQARTNRSMLGMGTTLVALAVVENDDGVNGLAVAHIGDSRVYLYRDKALMQVTVDHSVVQELVDEGQISEAQAAVHPQRHVLTRALGVEPAVDVDVIEIVPQNDDRYLLCSDGLPREASTEQIAAILSRFPDPSEAAQELVALANSRGGSDNVTVIVVDVLANEQSPDSLIIVPGPASSARPEKDEVADEEPPGRAPVDGGNGSPSAAPAGPASAASRAPAAGAQRTAKSRPAPRRDKAQGRLNLRVVGFVVALCVVVGGAFASVAWYARSAYFVGLSQGRIAIFQGRPGGVLWFMPTISDKTGYSASSVLSASRNNLRAGYLEPSLAQAHQWITNQVAEKREAALAARPVPPKPTTTSTTSRPAPTTSARPTTTSGPTTTARAKSSTTVRTAPTTAHTTQTTAHTTPTTAHTTPTTAHTTPTTTHTRSTSPASAPPSTTPAVHKVQTPPATHPSHRAQTTSTTARTTPTTAHTTPTTAHKARTTP